jgi:hypothetical protein
VEREREGEWGAGAGGGDKRAGRTEHLARMMAHGRRSESLTEMCCQSYCESM